MNKNLLVLRHELVTTITRPSFLFTAIGIPLISTLVLFGVSALNRNSPDTLQSFFGAGGQAAASEGYVDLGGLVRSLPESVPEGRLVAFPDEASARLAMDHGEISAFYIIDPDYLANGQVTYIRPDFNPLTAFDQSELIQWVLQVNLLGGDSHLANQANEPLKLQVILREPETQRDEQNPLTFFLPYAVTMIYYLTILMSSSLLLNSVTKEKENRVIEILMSALTPASS
jgi:ABC-2 type transport system permease protein